MAKRKRADDDDSDDDTPPAPSDAWVGLVGIATAALALAAVFLLLDANEIQPPPAAPQVVGGNGLLLPDVGGAAK